MSKCLKVTHVEIEFNAANVVGCLANGVRTRIGRRRRHGGLRDVSAIFRGRLAACQSD